SRGASTLAKDVLPAVGSPMMRILFTSSPYGFSCSPTADLRSSHPSALAHQASEAAEQVVAVARAGRGLGVVLHREHRPVLERDAAVRAVEQRHMGLDRGRRQGGAID